MWLCYRHDGQKGTKMDNEFGYGMKYYNDGK